MSECFNCGYWWADCDENGTPISLEYCHYVGPDDWAPCMQEDYELDDYWSDSAEQADYNYEAAYQEWLNDMRHEEELINEMGWADEFEQPYDYKEF